MSDDGQKAYFDRKIAEQCGEMRVLALRIADVSLQEEALKATRLGLVQAYSNQQVELQKLVGMAKRMLGLEGDWVCIIDNGELRLVNPGIPGEGPAQED